MNEQMDDINPGSGKATSRCVSKTYRKTICGQVAACTSRQLNAPMLTELTGTDVDRADADAVDTTESKSMWPALQQVWAS